jgi:hypothetical protein
MVSIDDEERTMPSSFSVHRFTRRDALRLGLGSLGAAPAWCAAAGEDNEFNGFAGTTVRFAGVAEAQRVLGADDDWMQATGDFQRQAVMGADSAVTMGARAARAGCARWPRWRRASPHCACHCPSKCC